MEESATAAISPTEYVVLVFPMVGMFLCFVDGCVLVNAFNYGHLTKVSKVAQPFQLHYAP